MAQFLKENTNAEAQAFSSVFFFVVFCFSWASALGSGLGLPCDAPGNASGNLNYSGTIASMVNPSTCSPQWADTSRIKSLKSNQSHRKISIFLCVGNNCFTVTANRSALTKPVFLYRQTLILISYSPTLWSIPNTQHHTAQCRRKG